MPGNSLKIGMIALVLLSLTPLAARAQRKPAARLDLHGAELQWSRLIGLFGHSPFADGAAALAAWKGGDPRPGDRDLGKAVEALIASLNPAMAREFRAAEGARLVAWPDDLGWRWSLLFPSDDGTIRDLLQAQSLTEGAREAPLSVADRDWAIDRLGPPGSLLAAAGHAGVAIAPDRETLALALALVPGGPPGPPAENAPGVTWEVDPRAFGEKAGMPERRVAEALLGFGGTRLLGHFRVEEDGLASSSRLETGSQLRRPVQVDPAWLDWIDAEAVAALSMALDPDRSSWDAVFRAADRAEKVDPEKRDLAPLRLRVNLVATAAGIRPERELYPRLRGLTATLVRPAGADPLLGLVVLHCVGEPEARALAGETLPRLLTRWLGEPADGSWASPDRGPVRVARLGPDVVVAFGIDTAPPQKSMRSYLEAFWIGSRPDRVGFARPPLLAAWAGSGASVVAALAQAPPLVWWGTTTADAFRDEVRWSGLSAPLANFLRAQVGPAKEQQP